MARFVYPYNFVPPAGEFPQSRKRYQELHRYEGKTGRLEFTLTNRSPLFVPDSEGTTYYHITDEHGKPQYDEHGKPKLHRVMDFFNIDGRLALPGTSLKGMIRQVVEPLSGSAFGVFTPDEGRFPFRKAKDLGGGINDVRKRAWGCWQADGTIQPMQAVKIWRDDFDSSLGLSSDHARAAEYGRLRATPTWVQAELWQLHTGNPHVRALSAPYAVTVFANAMSGANGGQLRARQTFKSEVVAGGRSIKGPMLRLLQSQLGLVGSGPWPVQFKTIANVPNGSVTGPAREERLCWIGAGGKEWRATNPGTRKVMLWPREGWEDMEPAQRRQSHYVAGLCPQGPPIRVAPAAKEDYLAANPKPGHLPRPGDIVRYYAESGTVVEFGPVAMFKTPERASVLDIARQTPGLLPPRGNQQLDPAGRLFGWTPEGKSLKEEDSPVAGRVRVGPAWSERTLDDTVLIPLQILGTPRPGYYPFYLRPRDTNKDASRIPAYYATQPGGWWHTAGLLRGWKFYLHHPDARSEDPAAACDAVSMKPEMVSDEVKDERPDTITPRDLRSHQNGTAAVLPPGATFKGYVEFDSLSDHELGLLLWAVSLSDSPLDGSVERAHKLGMGRPTGLGSVQLKIDSVVTWDPVGGWQDEHDPGAIPIDKNEAQRLVKVFKAWMVTGQALETGETPDDKGVARFNDSASYRSLCDVLSLELAGSDPVQYYPPGTSAYKGFDWFVSQRVKRNQGTEQPLKTPDRLRAGDRQTDA